MLAHYKTRFAMTGILGSPGVDLASLSQPEKFTHTKESASTAGSKDMSLALQKGGMGAKDPPYTSTAPIFCQTKLPTMAGSFVFVKYGDRDRMEHPAVLYVM